MNNDNNCEIEKTIIEQKREKYIPRRLEDRSNRYYYYDTIKSERKWVDKKPYSHRHIGNI